ncbi:peptidase domain-containing ABC transporter [Dictyobacter kobayashii]|uniref:NHLP family bacteriocin export ABC transporter peptidase/permease/ATPase n=1 Tax=Dictyobacter kobayashii TaxID=2014872 RepID=A0A402AX42_9CHLR|nr:peptidase domain-containing ABC transporter [Dictyobacter kobayashii]GCE23691.1 NHLP family bacteriocin export ABC transporter peptidase/permease/ATPase [Dictyobacter kobayashii]
MRDAQPDDRHTEKVSAQTLPEQQPAMRIQQDSESANAHMLSLPPTVPRRPGSDPQVNSVQNIGDAGELGMPTQHMGAIKGMAELIRLAQLIQEEERRTDRQADQSASSSSAAKHGNKQPLQRKKKSWRRVPEMRQMSEVECGAACLAMILNYHGCATIISEVQERCGVGRDGLSALAILESAHQYGLRSRPVSIKDIANFRFVMLPAIVHWEFNHFIVVERWSNQYVDVVDPAVGRRRLTAEEFADGFTGVVLMLEPGPQFERRTARQTLSLTTYTRSLLRLRGTIVQILLASLLLQLFGLGTPLLTRAIVDNIIPMQAVNLLTFLGVGMIILILTQGITMFLRSSLLIYLQTRIDAQMMLNFFEHMLSLPYRFFQLRLSGDLLSRVNSNIVIRDLLSNQLVSTLLDGSTVIVYMVILFSQSPLIAGIALVIGLIEVALLGLSAPAIRRMTQKDLAAQGKTQGYLNEALSGIATLKAAGAEQRALDRWTNLFFDEMNISMRLKYLTSIISALMNVLQLLAPLVLLWVGALQVIHGMMSVGSMLALNVLAASFLTPFSSLATTSSSLQIVRAHFERISDVVSAEIEQNPQQVSQPPRLTGHIVVKDVSFQYDAQTPMAVRDITVSIQPGQKVALVGKTGSGKSTLGKLLIGLITPTQGDILFDGLSLRTLNYRALRSQIGTVLQEAFIFSGSVRENIALNDPEMDMERVVLAAQAADLHEDIEKMPMQYETLVSEGGSAFSGGQRQRLALARALATRPGILLLDEATSALDVATERTVEKNISALSCTQIIIAHRLSTIRHADLILVLDEGRIVEQGSHATLLGHNGYYARLIQAQMEDGTITAG